MTRSLPSLIPSKTQTYLAAGRPLLVAVRGDTARLVQEAAAGLICPPEQPAALAAGVQQLHDLPASERDQHGPARPRVLCGRHLDMPLGVTILLARLSEAAGIQPDGPLV